MNGNGNETTETNGSREGVGRGEEKGRNTVIVHDTTTCEWLYEISQHIDYVPVKLH